MRVHMPIIREIVRGAVRAGADPALLREAVGFTWDELEQADRFVGLDDGHRTWLEALRLTRDPLLGLHIGEQVSPSMIGLVGHLMQSSPTLAVALQQVCAFNETFTDMFRYGWEEHSTRIHFVIEPAAGWWKLYPDTAAQARDQAASGVVHVCSLLADKRITPVEVQFTTRRTAHHAMYEQVLGCPVRYQASHNAVVFDKQLLQTPVASYNQSLFKTFEALLQQQLKETPLRSVSAQIRSLVETEYGYQPPSLDVLAARLHTTPRSLQRKLSEEKTSYRALMADVRMHLARKLLAQSPEKIYTIATWLGYADASTFRRAFKQWMQKTPKEYRRKRIS